MSRYPSLARTDIREGLPRWWSWPEWARSIAIDIDMTLYGGDDIGLPCWDMKHPVEVTIEDQAVVVRTFNGQREVAMTISPPRVVELDNLQQLRFVKAAMQQFMVLFHHGEESDEQGQ